MTRALPVHALLKHPFAPCSALLATLDNRRQAKAKPPTDLHPAPAGWSLSQECSKGKRRSTDANGSMPARAGFSSTGKIVQDHRSKHDVCCFSLQPTLHGGGNAFGDKSTYRQKRK